MYLGKHFRFSFGSRFTKTGQNAAEIVRVDKTRFEDLRSYAEKQKYFGKDGLYFCGFWIGPGGQIHEISSAAQKISKDIAQKKGLLKGTCGKHYKLIS